MSVLANRLRQLMAEKTNLISKITYSKIATIN